MKLGKKFCPIVFLYELENVYVFLKNMAAMGLGIFPYM